MRPQGQGVATALPLFMIRSDPVPHRGHEKSEQVQDHSRSRTGRVVIMAGKGRRRLSGGGGTLGRRGTMSQALRDGAARLAIGRPAVAAPVARPDLPVAR